MRGHAVLADVTPMVKALVDLSRLEFSSAAQHHRGREPHDP